MPAHNQNTHLKINANLCGRVVEITEQGSQVTLMATPTMAVDEKGLVHGGFVFGLADYAAMVAVNHPNVVLGSANVKFLKPVRVGDTLVATATKSEASGKKHLIKVEVRRGEVVVFAGDFTCFVLEKHVLD